MAKRLPPLYIGNLEFKIPIMQGAMGVAVSGPNLVSAVSNLGALGELASVGLGEFEQDIHIDYQAANSRALRKAIQKTREKTDKPFAVNIMSVLRDYESLCKTCSEENVDVIVSGAGPFVLKLPKYVENPNTKLIPKLSSAEKVKKVTDSWQKRYNRLPDAVIVEGPLSGGHQGFTFEQLDNSEQHRLENILIDTLNVVRQYETDNKKIPIIAGGGIFDGKDIAKFINLGASGVLLGSRFVCTDECDADIKLKEQYIKAGEEDITLILSPVGLPVRIIKNEFYHRMKERTNQYTCEYNCLITCDHKSYNYCIARALLQAQKGDMKNGIVLCSTTTHKINKIIPVKELVDNLIEETKEYLQ